MARKRMISPEIWESQNFSKLSDVAKIVFISLFSHADDEGRGRADSTFIKNITFPYDENRRVADIKSALSEIARRMSVQFYSVNGIDYYFMTHWERWQKVDKPSKSKLPPPPYVGEGGAILSNEKFGESSGSVRGIVGESSTTNRIEKNRKESNIPPNSAGAREELELTETLNEFCKEYSVSIDTNSPLIADIDWQKLDKAYSESTTFLMVRKAARYLSWVVKNYQSIISGKYADEDKPIKGKKQGIVDSWQALHDKYLAEEGEDVT